MIDTAPATLKIPPVIATAHLRGHEAAALLEAFPPRSNPASWPATEETRDDVLKRLSLPAFAASQELAQRARLVGARLMLEWLESFPGDTWQARWDASPASSAYDGWPTETISWWRRHGRKPYTAALRSGLLALVCADVIRPGLHWIAVNQSRYLRVSVEAARDPDGFARLKAALPSDEWSRRPGPDALKAIARIVAALGGGVDDITVGDILALLLATPGKGTEAVRLAYTWLRNRGQFPPDAPATLHNLTSRAGQVDVARLVDRYHLQCQPIRDLLVDYLNERRPSLDYNSLKSLSANLVGLFWADLERHHPGIDSLQLSPEVRDGWKARVVEKTVRRRQPDGTVAEVTTPRISAPGVKLAVRAFYLDLAEWSLEEPERWGRWAAPSPLTEADCDGKKAEKQQKARSGQRTRERLPVLPVLVRTANQRLADAKVRLDAVNAAAPGSTVTVLGETFTIPRTRRRSDPGHVYDANGRRRNIAAEEKQAFIAWSTIEILRHTGIRIEELMEIGHHSIISYTLPSTGEVVPLLQIAPSKTDKERLLLINPELADVLSRIISRLRGPDGTITAVHYYDLNEQVWNPPMPILYQWSVSGENRAISVRSVRDALAVTLKESGIVDKSGNPLTFQPHDFRRIFITDAILNGLPPHIAQVIAGHDNLNTTMGYAAIYPSDTIEAHKAFIARRRSLRPAEEYRAVTPEEWEEFLGHFERRKLALGECGRAYGTDCAHEHACVRCPVLIVSPAERERLVEIRDNLGDRIAEAEREGWLGEIEGLQVSRTGAEEKLAQLDAQSARKREAVHLGIPAFPEVVARTSTIDTLQESL
ncbi:site-specific integrase [Streptomyces kronopolitis]|uniref:site-specific integrase n=1 Tax=Streptomyces kronopolitis TaxID=1612435 RepID=UPI003441EE20